MRSAKSIMVLIALILTLGAALAADFDPRGNVNLRGTWNITNASNVCFKDGTCFNTTSGIGGGGSGGIVTLSSSNAYVLVSNGTTATVGGNETAFDARYQNWNETLNGSLIGAGTVNIAYLDTSVATDSDITTVQSRIDDVNATINTTAQFDLRYYSILNPWSFLNLSTLPTWAYNGSYVTFAALNTILDGQVNTTYNETYDAAAKNTSLATYTYVNTVVNGNASIKANLTDCTGSNSTHAKVLNSTSGTCILVSVNPGAGAAAESDPIWSANSSTIARTGSCVGGNSTHVNVSNATSTSGVTCVLVSRNPGGGAAAESDPVWSANESRVTALETKTTNLATANSTLNTSVSNLQTTVNNLVTANSTLNTSITNANTRIGDVNTTANIKRVGFNTTSDYDVRYLQSYTETDPLYNRTWNETRAKQLFIQSNGTLTGGKWCTWSGNDLDCNVEPVVDTDTAYNASYATNAAMNTAFLGQWNVSPASITGNLTNYLLTSTFLTVLNGQNNLSLSTIVGNIGNWTADKAGYVTSGALTGNLSSYVTIASLSGNLSLYATNNALLGNLSAYITINAYNGNTTAWNGTLCQSDGTNCAPSPGDGSYNVTYATGIANLQSANITLNTSVTNIQTAVNNLQTANTTLNTSVTNVRTAVGDLQQANITLNTSLTNVRTKADNLATANITLNTSVANLQNSVATMNLSIVRNDTNARIVHLNFTDAFVNTSTTPNIVFNGTHLNIIGPTSVLSVG